MKKILGTIFVCVALFSCLFFAAGCKNKKNKNEEQPCEHVFVTSWSSDESYHYHECIKCGAIKDKEAHTAKTTYVTTADQHWQECAVCGAIMNKTSHDFSHYEYDEAGHVLSCVCGLEKAKELHEEKEYVKEELLVNPVSCHNPASYYKSCKCGWHSYDTFEYGEADPTKHIYDQEIVQEPLLASDGDCTHSALYYKTCTCGAVGTETFASGVYKHTDEDEDGICDVSECKMFCGEVLKLGKASKTIQVYGIYNDSRYVGIELEYGSEYIIHASSPVLSKSCYRSDMDLASSELENSGFDTILTPTYTGFYYFTLSNNYNANNINATITVKECCKNHQMNAYGCCKNCGKYLGYTGDYWTEGIDKSAYLVSDPNNNAYNLFYVREFMSNARILDDKKGMFASGYTLIEGGLEIYDYNGTKWTVEQNIVNNQYVFNLPAQDYPLDYLYIYIVLKVPKSINDPCAWLREYYVS